jgi:nucleoside 2-deoxyribosyltransferase
MSATLVKKHDRPSAIFISASFFDWADRAFNRKLQEHLTSAGHMVTLLQEKDGGSGERGLFDQRVEGLKNADLVLAVVTGADLDPCVAFEMGLAQAWGIPVIVMKTDFKQRSFNNPQAVNYVLEFGSGKIVTGGQAFFDDAVKATDHFFATGMRHQPHPG